MAAKPPLKRARLTATKDMSDQPDHTNLLDQMNEPDHVFVLDQLNPVGGWPSFVTNDEDIGASQLAFIGSVASVGRTTATHLDAIDGMDVFVCDMHLWVLKHYITQSHHTPRAWFRTQIQHIVCRTGESFVLLQEVDLTSLHAAQQLIRWFQSGHPLVPTKARLIVLLTRVWTFCAGARCLHWKAHTPQSSVWVFMSVYEQPLSLHDIGVFIERYDKGDCVAWSAYFLTLHTPTHLHKQPSLFTSLEKWCDFDFAVQKPYRGLEPLMDSLIADVNQMLPAHEQFISQPDETIQRSMAFIHTNRDLVHKTINTTIIGNHSPNSKMILFLFATGCRYLAPAPQYANVHAQYNAPQKSVHLDVMSGRLWDHDIPDFTQAHKTAVLMGLHTRLGQDSAVQRSLRQQSHFEPKLLQLIFGMVDNVTTLADSVQSKI